MPSLRRVIRNTTLCLLTAIATRAEDPLKEMQNAAVATKDEKRARPYHFGSQGPNDVFSNHTTHANRLVPVYAFGRRLDLGSITGPNSPYRDPARVRRLFGTTPTNTVNPDAEYGDQSELNRVQRDAVARGVKYLFTVWFDGLDWPTTQAAAVLRTGKVYRAGKGAGLAFQDETADGTAQYGFVATSPTHSQFGLDLDLDTQSVRIRPENLGGGYDVQIAGPDPWTPGPLFLLAPGYLKGQHANEADRKAVVAVGRFLHAYTDSAPSAGAYATGVKSYNASVNVRDDGQFVPTLFNQLQASGWKVGTLTSVGFAEVSPAAQYAHNVSRDDQQDLARDMLGLRGIGQESGKDGAHPGLDVVIGTGCTSWSSDSPLRGQGRNGVGPGNVYLTDADRAAIDVIHGGPYVVARAEPGVDGTASLRSAAARAAREGRRLFGFFRGVPFQTADGRFDPANGIGGTASTSTEADRRENPTLAEMTGAALTVLGADKARPFALFVEAGDVDNALHDNNLDNAIGAIYSGEAAVRVIFDWVKTHSNWDESAVIVTSDHGHFLVIDDIEALARARR